MARSKKRSWGRRVAHSVLSEFGALGRGLASIGENRKPAKKTRGAKKTGGPGKRALDVGRQISSSMTEVTAAIDAVADSLTRDARDLEAALTEASLRANGGPAPPKRSGAPSPTTGSASQNGGGGSGGIIPVGFGGAVMGSMAAGGLTAIPLILAYTLKKHANTPEGKGVRSMLRGMLGIPDDDPNAPPPWEKGGEWDKKDDKKKDDGDEAAQLRALRPGAVLKRIQENQDAQVSMWDRWMGNEKKDDKKKELMQSSFTARDTMTFKAREIEFRGASGAAGVEGPRGVWDLLSGNWSRRERDRVNSGGSPGAAPGGGGGGGPPRGHQSNGPGRGYNTERGGKGEFNYGLTEEGKAELKLNPDGSMPDSQKTVIRTKDGRQVVVNKETAPQQKAFLDHLESRGYKINDIGGYANRNKVGGSGKSTHATGGTMDINPSANPFHGNKTDMPGDIDDIAGLHGQSSGHKFGDPMHFERMSSAAHARKIDDMVRRGVITPDVGDYVKKNRAVPPGLVDDRGQIKKDFKPGDAPKPEEPKQASPDEVKRAEKEQYDNAMKRNPFGVGKEKLPEASGADADKAARDKPASFGDDLGIGRYTPEERAKMQAEWPPMRESWQKWPRSENVEDYRERSAISKFFGEKSPVEVWRDMMASLEHPMSFGDGSPGSLADQAGFNHIQPEQKPTTFDERFGEWGEPEPQAVAPHVIVRDRTTRQDGDDADGKSEKKSDKYDEGPTMRDYAGGVYTGGP